MAETRRGFLAGLLLVLAPALRAEAAPPADPLFPAQYFPPSPPPPAWRHRRRRRCWIERRRIMVRGRDGRFYPRIVNHRVCR